MAADHRGCRLGCYYTSWLVSSDRLREVQPLVTTDGFFWPPAAGLACTTKLPEATGKSIAAS
jgi:hypothetical protein